MPAPLLVLALFIAVLFGVAADTAAVSVIAGLLVVAASEIIWWQRKQRYFASEEFQALKRQTAEMVSEHNAVVDYVAEIRAKGTFNVGASPSGEHAHLATFNNTSSWNYRRDRNVAEYAPHVHNASLQVVRNASADPLKYVMKYFSIKANREMLAEVQRVAEDIARLEEAVANVERKEEEIAETVSPPAFILRRYSKDFWNQVGAELTRVKVPYPTYTFQYVSAGGNSSQTTSLTFDTPTLEALSAVLVEKIRWAKSAAGQRALMTAKLRDNIKQRDGYACRACSVSVAQQPHLLLEVDHITPVSKGGLSLPENLQTLCWRCNRAKGAKMPTGHSAESQPAEPQTATRIDYTRRR